MYLFVKEQSLGRPFCIRIDTRLEKVSRQPRQGRVKKGHLPTNWDYYHINNTVTYMLVLSLNGNMILFTYLRVRYGVLAAIAHATVSTLQNPVRDMYLYEQLVRMSRPLAN